MRRIEEDVTETELCGEEYRASRSLADHTGRRPTLVHPANLVRIRSELNVPAAVDHTR